MTALNQIKYLWTSDDHEVPEASISTSTLLPLIHRARTARNPFHRRANEGSERRKAQDEGAAGRKNHTSNPSV